MEEKKYYKNSNKNSFIKPEIVIYLFIMKYLFYSFKINYEMI